MVDTGEDYFDGLPYTAGDVYENRGLTVQRVTSDEEEAFAVDFVISERYLRLGLKADGNTANELGWEARTTFYEPDELQAFAEELQDAADWIREMEADDGD